MRLAISLSLIAAACVACSDAAAPRGRVALSPSVMVLVAGDTGRIRVQNVQSTVVWWTAAPATATVDAGGLVTGVAPGVALVWARSGGDSTAASVTVTPRFCLLTPTVSPASVTLAVGDTTRAEASQSGCSPIAAGTNWTSSDPAVATVVSRGALGANAVAVITGRKAGEAVVTA